MKEFLEESESAEEAGIDLTPMLDVVFIMLIFFIVTGQFRQGAGLRRQSSAADQRAAARR